MIENLVEKVTEVVRRAGDLMKPENIEITQKVNATGQICGTDWGKYTGKLREDEGDCVWEEKELLYNKKITQKEVDTMTHDLTIGTPRTVLWKFCLPLFGSIIFQQLYNIADSLVAGKFIGENALAAVGNSYEITLIFIAFAFGCNMGCSVVASQLFGARQYKEWRVMWCVNAVWNLKC